MHLECNSASTWEVAGTTSFLDVEIPAAGGRSKNISVRVEGKRIV